MIKITFTGDIMCEYSRLNQYYKEGAYDFTPIFSDVIPTFIKSDFVVVNLESPLAGRDLVYSDRNYSFNTPDEMATALNKCGVGLVTTANNHVLDRGVVGLERTLDILDATGISHTGSYRRNDSPKPFITTVGDIKIAFLSYTYGTEACFNNYYLKKDQYHMVNLTRNQELTNPIKRYFLVHKSIPAKAFRFLYRLVSPTRARLSVSERNEKDFYQKKHLLSDIDYCKAASVDYIIMCLHSGGQFNTEPTENTKKTVEFCLSNGVDAIITNHEHTIQKACLQKNQIIAYCLGNFTSDYGISRKPFNQHAEYSALLHIYLEKNEKLKARCSVSFVKSHLNHDGVIVTSPVSQLFRKCTDENLRETLIRDNLWCLNTFFGLSLNEAPIQDEYPFDEYSPFSF